MILAGTGHRPNKLGGYGKANNDKLISFAEKAIVEFGATQIISGMALGWDCALAQAALNQNIKVIAAVPFKGQEKVWPQESKNNYWRILDEIEAAGGEMYVVCEGGYDPFKMQLRNQWMIDKCDKVLALWNESPGGTANAVDYAQKQKKEIINLWKRWVLYNS